MMVRGSKGKLVFIRVIKTSLIKVYVIMILEAWMSLFFYFITPFTHVLIICNDALTGVHKTLRLFFFLVLIVSRSRRHTSHFVDDGAKAITREPSRRCNVSR